MSGSITASPRLDVELVRRGLARSREHATELIAAGAVVVGGRTAHKPSARLTGSAEIVCHLTGPVEVSRGAGKLRGALADLGPLGLAVKDRRCLDAGSSTGGFTQVLLEAGARSVVAVDVGTDQLVDALRADPRVSVREQTDIRDVTPETLGGAVDLAVADLAFISLRLVLPALRRCVVADGDLVVMVKPQFEVGRKRIGRGGVVRDPTARADALLEVAAQGQQLGLGVAGAAVSRRPGAAGTLEYFLWMRAGAPSARAHALRALAAADPLEAVAVQPVDDAADHAVDDRSDDR